MSTFKPVIVLAAISAIVSALIIITYNLTYVDTSNLLTDKQKNAIISIYGGSEEEYEVIPAEDWQPVLLLEDDTDLSRVTKLIRKADGSVAFEVVVKGYKEGYDLMVGVKDGAVAGVSVVSVGSETPELGTKTADPSFLERFKGKSGEVVIVKTTPAAENEVQGVTSATRSSNGVAKAVNIALAAYNKLKDNIVICTSYIPENAGELMGGEAK